MCIRDRFNSQIVTNRAGTFTILCPENCRQVSAAESLLSQWIADDSNPISEVVFLPLDQSMANGGGPACLRLRIQMTAQQLVAIPKQFAIDDAKADEIAGWIERWYPETLSIAELADVKFAEHCWAALDDLQSKLTASK